MTTTKKTSNPAPLAHRVPAEVSDLIATYSAWLEEQTGVKIDPMSVYLGSQLRSVFQKSEGNQARLREQAKRVAAERAAKEQRKAEREAAAATKAAEAATEKPAPKAKADKPAPKTPAKRAPRRPTKAAQPAMSGEAVQA